ncbi:hypothetical protein NDU88_003325 [Pleurodeles waltl]|uniref:Uncharacterized protein n=1 Tax=Pleurodeles waltl TaxID=8319 RepID=A0AAV7T550_PLEWA|nr:hypothetical protein NDU88_003325 [Pleurodeles waltl]
MDNSGDGSRNGGTKRKPHPLRCQPVPPPGRRVEPRERKTRSSSLRISHGSEGRSQAPVTQAGGLRPPPLGSAAPSQSLLSGV